MRNVLRLLLLLLLVVSPSLGLAQIHTFPALDTNNNWTGINTFPTGSLNLGNTNFLSSATVTRTFTFPDANSNPVQPSTAPSNQFATGISSAGVISYGQPAFGNLLGAIALSQTPLTTRGDLLVVGSGPALARLPIGAANLYPKSNGTDIVFSTLAAGGVGSCTNQVVTSLNADAAPTCATVSPVLTTGTTGTGSTFVLSVSPTLTTPNLGDATATSIVVSGAISAGTVSSTGGALNGSIGATTPGSGAFTTLSASGASTSCLDNGVAIVSSSCYATLALAYAALPANGGKIQVESDIMITSADALTLSLGKPVDIDGNDHQLICSVPNSTVCETILANGEGGGPRYMWSLHNLTFILGNTSTGVTGLQVGSNSVGVANIEFRNIEFKSFNTSGSVGMSLTNVQDSGGDSVHFTNNATALTLNLNTIQDRWQNFHFQGNVNAVITTDSHEQTFADCLVQSSTGTTPFQITAVTVGVANITIKHCHFENNGDDTANGRQILFNPGTGHQIASVIVEDNTFAGGANVSASSFVYGVTGAGSVNGIVLVNNIYGSLTTTNFWSGLANATNVSVIGEGSTPGTVTFPSNATNCNGDGGLGLTPAGAAKSWTIFGGFPSNFDGFLIFRDCTDNTNILTYQASSTTWTVPGKISNNVGTVMATVASGTANMTTAAIASLACGTTVTVAATGVLTSDSIITAEAAAPTSPNGLLRLEKWPTAGNVNFAWCNPTAASQTPAAETINWRVPR